MRNNLRLGCSVLCISIMIGAGSLHSQGPAKNAAVAHKVVSYEELAKEIVKLRGKVVVVDLWYPT